MTVMIITTYLVCWNYDDFMTHLYMGQNPLNMYDVINLQPLTFMLLTMCFMNCNLGGWGSTSEINERTGRGKKEDKRAPTKKCRFLDNWKTPLQASLCNRSSDALVSQPSFVKLKIESHHAKFQFIRMRNGWDIGCKV